MRVQHQLQATSNGEKVVIVGTGESAAVAWEYFNYDSPHEVVAFSTETHCLTSDVYCGLPVVPLERIAEFYLPDKHQAFVAISPTGLNRLRRRLYDAVKAAGFTCISYVSSHAFVLPNVEIGENTFVQENTALQYRTRIGDNVFLGSGSCIGHSSVIEDDCYVGPHATVCGNCMVGRSSFLGANSCIAHTVSVAEDCVIGGGAVILKDTKARHVYLGNPGRPTSQNSFETWPAKMVDLIFPLGSIDIESSGCRGLRR
jgi:sugar O-acyltransferase (sialic acid O-acetyltransferase NeuD family)